MPQTPFTEEELNLIEKLNKAAHEFCEFANILTYHKNPRLSNMNHYCFVGVAARNETKNMLEHSGREVVNTRI